MSNSRSKRSIPIRPGTSWRQSNRYHRTTKQVNTKKIQSAEIETYLSVLWCSTLRCSTCHKGDRSKEESRRRHHVDLLNRAAESGPARLKGPSYLYCPPRISLLIAATPYRAYASSSGNPPTSPTWPTAVTGGRVIVGSKPRLCWCASRSVSESAERNIEERRSKIPRENRGGWAGHAEQHISKICDKNLGGWA